MNDRRVGGRSLTDGVASAIGVRVETATSLSGGDVADSFRLTLADGRAVFAKTHRDPPPEFFTTEAAGLTWLAQAGAVAVPEVLAVSDGDETCPPFLVLAWVAASSRPPTAESETRFGRQLAALHRAGAPCYGRTDRRTTGSRRLPNEPCDRWVSFYATQRLEPLHRLAHDAHALPDSTLELLDRAIGGLAKLGGPPEPPARLHGDLWSGNRLVDADGTSWLIDPAAHGGHREFDLAMMRLFGGFGRDVFDAYDDEFPLADGWLERVPLHQLAPLIVHAIKFDGGYPAAVRRALDALPNG